jgi:tetratricopeptide (TPR) repeat protein
MIQLHYEKKGLDFRKLAKESIARARIIDNKLPTVNAQMALINLWDLDFSAARFNIDLATSVKNKNTDTIEIVAYYYQLTGQIEKSVKLLDEAIDQDPLNDTFYYNLSMGYYFLNQLKDAGKFMSKYYYFHEKAHLFKAMASQFYVSEGKNQDALELAKQEPNEFQKLLSMGYATHALGDNKQADDILNELLTKYSTSSSYIASLYAFRQDADNAFKWLNSAFDGRNTELLYAINFDTFQNLWDDPRWQLFINKISLPKEHWLIRKEIKAD